MYVSLNRLMAWTVWLIRSSQAFFFLVCVNSISPAQSPTFVSMSPFWVRYIILPGSGRFWKSNLDRLVVWGGFCIETIASAELAQLTAKRWYLWLPDAHKRLHTHTPHGFLSRERERERAIDQLTIRAPLMPSLSLVPSSLYIKIRHYHVALISCAHELVCASATEILRPLSVHIHRIYLY